MSSRKRWAGGAVLLGTLVAAIALIVRPAPDRAEAAGQPGGEPKGKAGAEAEVRKANADYAAALAAGDADAVMAFWAADADYIDEAGKLTQGSEKIAALFRKALPDLKGAKVAVRV